MAVNTQTESDMRRAKVFSLCRAYIQKRSSSKMYPFPFLSSDCTYTVFRFLLF